MFMTTSNKYEESIRQNTILSDDEKLSKNYGVDFYLKGGFYKKNIVYTPLNVKRVDACFQRLAMQDIHSFHFRFKENPARQISE